jgi:hypothetical protein
MVGLTITGNPIANFAVGRCFNSTIKGTYTITQAISMQVKVVNTALATAKDPKGNSVTDVLESNKRYAYGYPIDTNSSYCFVKNSCSRWKYESR